MERFKGLFELQSAKDLLKKLRHDYSRLEKNPTDQYAAFDLFITAEHMLDWLYPTERAKHEEVRDANPLLQVCSHIANGSKHFEATAKRHQSGTGTSVRKGPFDPAVFAPGVFNVGALIIHLDGENARQTGRSIDAVKLARMILDFWEGCADSCSCC